MPHVPGPDQPTLFDTPVAEGTQPEAADLDDVVIDPQLAWPEQALATFDLETTGRDARTCRIVTASVLLVAPDGQILGQWEWLADPGVEIPDGAAAIHGITTEHAREHGAPAGQVVSELVQVIGDLFVRNIPVLAFNAPYDFTVLAAEAQRHGLDLAAPRPVLDPYVMHKQVRVRWHGKRTLVALSEAYGIPLESAHTSAEDALAAVRLAQILAREHAELCVPAAALHDAQIGWAEAQALNLQDYLRGVKSDPTIVIDGTWPVRS